MNCDWSTYLLYVSLSSAAVLLVMAAGTINSDETGSRPVEPARVAPSPVAVPEGPLTVEAVGREFVWHFRLAGSDGRLGTPDDVDAGNHLHLPVDRVVTMLVRSSDFIYRFNIPALDLRELAVPELTHKLTFRTGKTGEFEVLADPLCSVRWYHDERMARVRIESRGAFGRWYRDRSSGVAGGRAREHRRGERL